MYISAEARELKVISIGDWGERKLPFQDMVADGMAIWAEENNPDWIFTTGDNFYPKGINSPFDPALNRKWRNVYNHTSLVDLKWYIDLGNHDFGDWNGEEWNQIELTQYEPRWICPHLWYDFVEDLGDATVHFVFIDTESFQWQVERNNYTEMLFWMEDVLKASTADWKLVIGHRHVFSVGDSTPVTHSIYNVLVPIMERNNVDAYICGHDHNLQHLKNITGKGMDYVISGNGGALPTRYILEYEVIIRENYHMEPLYYQYATGFVTLTVNREGITFDFFNNTATLGYTFTRTKEQKIKI